MADAESITGESKSNEPVTALVNEIVELVNETINVGAPSVAGMTTQELLDTIESLDEEPETTTAASAVAATVAATAGAADDRSTGVATVHHVEWRYVVLALPRIIDVPSEIWCAK